MDQAREYVKSTIDTASIRCAPYNVAHMQSLQADLWKLGNAYLESINPETIELHAPGVPNPVGIMFDKHMNNREVGDAFALAMSRRMSAKRKTGDSLFSLILTADDIQDANRGIYLRYAETVSINTAATDTRFDSGVYLKPVDIDALAREFTPDCVRMGGPFFLWAQGNDQELQARVREMFDVLPEGSKQ